MHIALCHSMVFTEKALEVQSALQKMGHQVSISSFAQAYVGKTEKEKEAITIFHKNEKDAIREYWNEIQKSDAILVLNYDRRGVANYVGGNALMEIGFAHVLSKKIFLMNPIPDIQFYKSEIESVKPVIINGNLSLVK